MILVTGGTGLVGAHLLYRLLNEKKAVRAIYRNEKKFDNVKRVFSYYSENAEMLFDSIEWVKADLSDIPSLTEAFTNVSHVYHCAAFVSFEPDKFEVLQKTNIEGTANIVNLSISNAIEKLCHVSSIATMGHAKNDELITEETEWNSEMDHNVYTITKYGAELEVWRGTQEGLDVVIVNPGVIIGPGIWNYGSGSLIKTVYKGMKYFTSGITGFVSVDDVVTSMIQLMKSNMKNERFIVVADNWSYRQFLTTCAKGLNVNPPKKEAKNWLLQIGWRLDWLKHKLTGQRRTLTRQLSNSLTSESNFDHSKLKTQLNFKFEPISDSIAKVSKAYLKDIG